MPNFFEINNSNENTVELLNSFIEKLSIKTNRNVIIYYSGWLSTSPDLPNGINDSDKVLNIYLENIQFKQFQQQIFQNLESVNKD